MNDFGDLKNTETPRVSIAERLNQISEKLSSFEKALYDNQMEIDHLKSRIDQLEGSFLDEIAKSAKTKFDSFRDYLASKIKP